MTGAGSGGAALPASIHAGCIVIGPFGILLRGASGSGKSALADVLVQHARSGGHFAALVSDDRTVLARGGKGQLTARPARNLEGLIEVRGAGIFRVPHEKAAVVRLAVDLLPPARIDRLPEWQITETVLEGVRVPRIEVAENLPQEAIRRIRWAFLGLFPNSSGYL
nr:aldolase [Roseibium litorale]